MSMSKTTGVPPQTIQAMRGTGDPFSQSALLDDWAAWVLATPSAAAYTLQRVEHMKSTIDMEHEYLLIHVLDPSGRPLLLKVDRNASSAHDAASKTGVFAPAPTAFDWVEVAPDACADRLVAAHGPSLALGTLTFPSPARAPSLVHLAVLLQTVRAAFPAYVLLAHQCFWFARTLVLALHALFRGTETPAPHAALRGTFRGAHVSLYAAGSAALQNALLLPLADFPLLIVPAGLFAVWSAWRMYGGYEVRDARERSAICDEKIVQHCIPDKYRKAWAAYEVRRDAEGSKPS